MSMRQWMTNRADEFGLWREQFCLSAAKKGRDLRTHLSWLYVNKIKPRFKRKAPVAGTKPSPGNDNWWSRLPPSVRKAAIIMLTLTSIAVLKLSHGVSWSGGGGWKSGLIALSLTILAIVMVWHAARTASKSEARKAADAKPDEPKPTDAPKAPKEEKGKEKKGSGLLSIISTWLVIILLVSWLTSPAGQRFLTDVVGIGQSTEDWHFMWWLAPGETIGGRNNFTMDVDVTKDDRESFYGTLQGKESGRVVNLGNLRLGKVGDNRLGTWSSPDDGGECNMKLVGRNKWSGHHKMKDGRSIDCCLWKGSAEE